MKLSVLPDAKFSCQACGNCCRNWHVELSAQEIARLEGFKWPAGDSAQGMTFTFSHGGHTYLKHAADHACVFLNRENNLCRIHSQFGEQAKPLGCQLYPFQITPTFKGEATVTPRYDCPSVRKNQGAAHADSLPQLRRYASQLNFSESALKGFDERDCLGFSRDQIEAVCEFAGILLNGFERNDQRVLFIHFLCHWLLMADVPKLNRAVLGNAFLELKQEVEAATASEAARPGMIHRMAFRTLLGLHIRRDEDVMDGRAGRLARLGAMLGIVAGGGDFQAMGVLHPAGSLRKARLFTPEIQTPDAEKFALYWQMVKSKLESLQFMGSGNGGRNFILGLRTLAMTYPLVVAAAKYRCGNRGGASIELGDVDYAVATIEHSFGRTPAAVASIMKSLENFLLEREAFIRLVRTV